MDIIQGVETDTDYLALSDKALLEQCQLDVYKSSGPGGQHRNKVSSAVRLRHRPTGIAAHGDESRSQLENKRSALRRLRMNIACRLRRPIDTAKCAIPDAVAECMFTPRGAGRQERKRLSIGARDHRFWAVAAFLLDVLDAFGGRLAEAADYLGITTSNLTMLLKSERHLFASAQKVRKDRGRSPIR
ncbi:MAG: peptide chain release factor family protein [Planctomycetota bacterium]